MTSTSKGRLTANRVREIHRLYAEGASQAELAARFSVSRTTISQVIRGITWAAVKKEPSHERRCPRCGLDLTESIKLLGAATIGKHREVCRGKDRRDT